MDKWADYCISAANHDETSITELKVHQDTGELGHGETWLRNKVVSSIEGGKTFLTIIKNSNGRYDKGANVHIFKLNGKKYLKTVADQTEKDNLGYLPGF
jgi:hypothetical protein